MKLTWKYLGLLALVLFVSSTAAAQALYVDCSGTNPDPTVFPNITAALASVTRPGATILVGSAACTENVFVNGLQNFSLGAYYGQTVTINGNVTVNDSFNVYLYGLNVTGSAGDGIDIYDSRPVVLDTCSSNGNAADGLYVGMGDIYLLDSNSFDNNAGDGIATGGTVWNYGPLDISNNKNPGVWVGGGSFTTFGAATILNNSGTGGSYPGFGVVSHGAGKIQFATCNGPNVIQGNQAGGIYIDENSMLSLWPCGEIPPAANLITGNGPVGIFANYGAEVTSLNTTITSHTEAGVALYGNSQFNVQTFSYGVPNLISQNGTAGDSRSGGIVVDGNSEVSLRGGQISSNTGPGILALVNSSADFSGVTFSGNSGGTINCDSSSFMVSDLPNAGPGVSAGCRTPHMLGNHHVVPISHGKAPDLTLFRKRQAQYKALAVPKKQ